MTSSDRKTSTRTYGGLREDERIHERRERFLEAGLEVFGTVGLRGATVRMLCKTAGLTERYFYESFADTEALFCAVYEKLSGALRDFFVAELPRLPADMDEKIPAAIDLFFTFMRNERMVRVLHVESMLGSERVTALHQTSTQIYVDITALLIRSDNPDVDMSPDFATALSLAVNGACTSMAVQWMLGGYRIPQHVMVQGCALIVRGAVHELRTLPRKSTL